MTNKLCGRLPQYVPAACKLTFDLLTLKVVSVTVRVTCDVGYLYANFNLPRPLCSRLRPDVRDRQTSDRQTLDVGQTDVRCISSLNASALWEQKFVHTANIQTPHCRTYNRRALFDFPQTLHGDRRRDH